MKNPANIPNKQATPRARVRSQAEVIPRTDKTNGISYITFSNKKKREQLTTIRSTFKVLIVRTRNMILHIVIDANTIKFG